MTAYRDVAGGDGGASVDDASGATTTDLIRSVALSSAELWHDVLQRLAELQQSQLVLAQAVAELNAVVRESLPASGLASLGSAAQQSLPPASTPTTPTEGRQDVSSFDDGPLVQKRVRVRRRRLRIGRSHKRDLAASVSEGAQAGSEDPASPQLAVMLPTLPPPPRWAPPPPVAEQSAAPADEIDTSDLGPAPGPLQREALEFTGEPTLTDLTTLTGSAASAATAAAAPAAAAPADSADVDSADVATPASAGAPVAPRPLVYTPATVETAASPSLGFVLDPIEAAPVVDTAADANSTEAAEGPTLTSPPSLERAEPENADEAGTQMFVPAGVGAGMANSSVSIATEILATHASSEPAPDAGSGAPAPFVISEDMILVSKNRRRRMALRIR